MFCMFTIIRTAKDKTESHDRQLHYSQSQCFHKTTEKHI